MAEVLSTLFFIFEILTYAVMVNESQTHVSITYLATFYCSVPNARHGETLR